MCVAFSKRNKTKKSSSVVVFCLFLTFMFMFIFKLFTGPPYQYQILVGNFCDPFSGKTSQL